MVFGPPVGLALAAFVAQGVANGAVANAGEIDVCAEAAEVADDPGANDELALDDLGDGERDCAPTELLPDAACEDAPATTWLAAASACDTPLFKLRKGPHRGPGLVAPSPGRRPLKDLAASDRGSFRASSEDSSPLPEKDLSFARDPALMSYRSGPRLAVARLPFVLGMMPPLAAGHARRLERPPQA